MFLIISTMSLETSIVSISSFYNKNVALSFYLSLYMWLLMYPRPKEAFLVLGWKAFIFA